MRRHKQTLIQKTVVAERRAALATYTGRCEAHGSSVDKLLPPRDISARRRNAAAGIFDERAGDQIRAKIGRLYNIRKLAVAVIDHNDRRGIDGLYRGAYFAYLLHGERGPVLIAA